MQGQHVMHHVTTLEQPLYRLYVALLPFPLSVYYTAQPLGHICSHLQVPLQVHRQVLLSKDLVGLHEWRLVLHQSHAAQPAGELA